MLLSSLRHIAAVRATTPRLFWYVWWGTLVNRIGGFVIPLLTLYLTKQQHLSVREAGAVVSMFGLGQIGASLVGGWLADRVGRRFTMLVGLFGGAVMMAALGFARTPNQMAVMVGLLALIGEMYRPAVSAFVADVVPSEHRVAAYGMLYWAVNLGFSLASLIGGVLAGVDFFLLFLIDAATMAIYGVVIAWKIPETLPKRRAARTGSGSESGTGSRTESGTGSGTGSGSGAGSGSGSDRGPLSDPVFLGFVAIALLFVLIPHQSNVVLTAHMTSQGFSSAAYGAVMSLNGVLIVVLQPWLTSHSSRRDPVRVLAVAMLVAGCGLALHGLATALWMHFLAVIIWTTGEILESPTRSAVVAAMAPPHARGRYQGALVLAWGGGTFLAPRLGSWLWDESPALLWASCAGLGVVVAGATLVVGQLWRPRMTGAMDSRR